MKKAFFYISALVGFVLIFSFNITAQTQDSLVVIGKQITFHSKILNEGRPILMYLPDGYEQNNDRYPVVMCHCTIVQI